MADTTNLLPVDAGRAVLIGRVWEPSLDGPTPCLLAEGHLLDVSEVAPTVSQILERPDAVDVLRRGASKGVWRDLGTIESIAGSMPSKSAIHLLAPCDLQPIKASGVTFVASLLERVIEERAAGDPTIAGVIRREIQDVVGSDLARVKPGSPSAEALKAMLISKNMWSQYLEVGIGVDAEIFTKGAPMSAVGYGAQVGLHPRSTWNNPEPEVVLAVNSRGAIRGATLGNDVNLRDFEGRSALLLGKAKDNNGSCAIGPFIRVFDDQYDLPHVRQEELTLVVTGDDGFRLEGRSSMSLISREPTELVSHAMGATHQYPDGVMLFCGTMFAPTQDRDQSGRGFTHRLGDLVRITSPGLGSLINRVDHSDKIPPWTFGIGALMTNLARRGLLSD